jgi:hypothetical protein
MAGQNCKQICKAGANCRAGHVKSNPPGFHRLNRHLHPANPGILGRVDVLREAPAQGSAKRDETHNVVVAFKQRSSLWVPPQ